MKFNSWKAIRIFISLLFLVATTFIFLDFSTSLPSNFINGITFMQFVPSLLKFIGAMGWLAIGFLLVILVTLIVGRVYCSTICPLGIFQDVVSWISKRTIRRKKNHRYRRPSAFLWYSVLFVAVLSLFLGSILALNLLDPFSIFGKIVSDLVRPIYYWLNNSLVTILETFNNYSLYPVETKQTNYFMALFPLLALAVIIWMSSRKGRQYCNTICPVGAFLGLVSKFSIFKIKIDNSTCTQCGNCSKVCKASCIDIKRKKVDFNRCVGCFNCLNTCESDSIGYRSLFYKMPKPILEVVDKGKRNNARKAFSIFLGLLSIKNIAEDNKSSVLNKKPTTIPEDKEFPVSPPGSLSLRHFTNSCTACHLCISACPSKVLQPSLLEYGIGGIMQPKMDYHVSYCNYDCIICSNVCPTGAIMSLTIEEKHTTQIGKVNFLRENCIVYTENTSCGACAEHCPTKAVQMVPYKENLTIPETNVDICVGCGACEFACPVRPYRAIYVDGNPEHLIAKLPIIKKLDEELEEDFPF